VTRPPSEIVLGEIVETFEGPIGIPECTRDPSLRRRASVCTTREIWKELADTVRTI
jgi:DNA-binding IscR family transcriptional regulator